MSSPDTLQALRIAGGIVPPNLHTKIQEGNLTEESLKPAAYHLASGENLRDAASRAWQYLRGAYAGWRQAQDSQPGGLDDTRAQLVRERWLLVLLRELGYGQVPTAPAGITIDGQEYPVSHQWSHIPVHLLGPGVDLDRRNPGVAGAARQPQAMVQELLNRTDDHLWAILSNARKLRLLRDSTELAGSAYVEFDLETIFDGELFAEFFLLWQMAHVSRLEKRGGSDAPAADCWLEVWRTEAVESGVRLLDRLRDGVQDALEALGTGFIRHTDNGWLVVALRNGTLSTRDYQRALLRLIYRLLFLFVAEDRDALLDPDASSDARDRYMRFFGTARLRRLARVRSGGPHSDLWDAQALVLRSLGGDGKTTGLGEPTLGLPALSGLFDPDPRVPTLPEAPQSDLLLGAALSNHDLLTAIRSLGWGKANGGRVMPVDYRNLGAEELGSVYESLLELEPMLDVDDQLFTLKGVVGNERKKSGSYYTPTALVSLLLDEALDPLLDRAVTEADDAADAERRLLALTVCDPACGSGHFLVAAARRMAQRLAKVRSGDDEPGVLEVQHALRDVVSRCIYGVDLNDLAAELAKVSLWLEALEPGKPLSVLDANIRIGNSLLGVTPKLLGDGIPDEALVPIEGDDKKVAAFLQKKNRAERSGQGDLFTSGGIAVENTSFGREVAAVITAPSNTLAEVHAQAGRLAALELSAELQHARLLADTWCAAFVQPKTQDTAGNAITYAVLDRLADHPESLTPLTRQRVEDLAREYRFFHWHLEFPHIFTVADGASPGVNDDTGWTGGFDCVFGNPPWDKLDFEDKKYFSVVDPEIAELTGASRRQRIQEWTREYPEAGVEYNKARRRQKATFHYAGRSGVFPLCAKGLAVKGVNSLQTDHLFAELTTTIAAPYSRYGAIIPTTIATGAGAQHLFKSLTGRGAIRALYGFENRKKLFPGVDSRQPFCVLSLVGKELSESSARLAFFLHDVRDLLDPERVFGLSPEDIALINPNTGTLPIFKSRRDADLTAAIYRRIPVLWNESDPDGNRWGVSFKNLFNMTDDSHLFHARDVLEADGWNLEGNVFTRDGERMLPLYEAKMVDFYNHRAADVVLSETAVTRQNQPRYLTGAEFRDPSRLAIPLNWINEGDIPSQKLDGNGNVVNEAGVSSRLSNVRWKRDWLYGWCDVTSATNERTSIVSFVPRAAVGHTFPLMFCQQEPAAIAALCACQSSFIFDYVSRQQIGGTHMALMTWKQLPVPPPDALAPRIPYLLPRVLELVYTAWDVAPLAWDLGDRGAPFQWVPERRTLIRAELDATLFHVYGLARDDVDYVMDTFLSVRRNDESACGEYRTKRLILEIYDAIAEEARTGVPYASVLDPEPGKGPRHREWSRPNWAKASGLTEEEV